ncbi:MAG: hypothetical protein U0625_10235 [Phycisphaerales bacterium]
MHHRRSPRTRSASWSIVAASAALTLASAAWAGPDVDEGARDAGATPTTAKQIRGNGQIASIAGTTMTAIEQGDVVDMFVFDIPNPAVFALEIDSSVTTFDSTLWLFRIIPPTSTQPERAIFISGNDDKSTTDTGARIVFPPGSGWGAGRYAVAIAPKGTYPCGLDVNRNPQPLFIANPDPTALLLPNTFGKRAALVLWQGTPTNTGVYRSGATGANMIPTGGGLLTCGDVLSGSCFVAHPATKGCEEQACCEVVCRIDPSCCSIAWDNNCATIADQNCARCSPDVCPADLNNDGVVNQGDLDILMNAWGPCN